MLNIIFLHLGDVGEVGGEGGSTASAGLEIRVL